MVARFGSGEDAAEWRAAMRRAAELGIRTGLANGGERIAWAHHVDHEVTEADEWAALAAACSDEPRVPFHQLVREEQREMLLVVRDDEGPAA